MLLNHHVYRLDLADTMWMLHDMRAHFVPRKFRSKSDGIPWKPYVEREPTPQEIRTWIGCLLPAGPARERRA